MSENSTRYRVGYALAPKKVQSFIRSSLINLAHEHGIDLVQIDLEEPLTDQGPFNCIIHKLSDQEWAQNLQDFCSQNPDVIIIDPLDAVARLHNRVSMLEVVKQLKIDDSSENCSIGMPKQLLVESSASLLNLIGNESVTFPVIAKPLVADGTADSHQMFLVFNKEGLRGLSPPIVLQEFVNHGGVIFKVYVAGQHVKCVKRRSLPDISEEKLKGALENVVPFSQISNVTAPHYNSDESIGRLVEEAEMPPLDFVMEVASRLRDALKLHLFNFDMIRDSRVGDRYLVIDINYLPGYAKMPSYETFLTDFLLDVLQRKQ